MKKKPRKPSLSKLLPGVPPGQSQRAPAPVELDAGVSLLSQAFEAAGALGSTLLAAQIGGGLSRLQQVLRRLAVVEGELAKRPTPPAPPAPPAEPEAPSAA